MRFIHAADIHLDSPLRGLGSYEDMPVDTLRGATRAAFSRLVDEALALEVDFMVIAGDLYDGDWKDHNTGVYFARQMGRLRNANIPVFVLHGNHDAESVMTSRLALPENVHVFSSKRPETFRLEEHKVALHGRSFPHAQVTENLASDYPAPLPGYFNIGVLHTALEGGSRHANYAPCSLAQLHASGYQYWALGHVHDYQVYPGPVPVVFPGNLQGRHIREQGAKGAALVSCVDGAVRAIELLEVDVLRWTELRLDIAPLTTRADVLAAIRERLEQELASQPDDKPSVLRLVLTGESLLYGELLSAQAQLRADVIATIAALADSRMWLEKLRLSLHPPRQAQPTSASDDLAALLGEAVLDPRFQQDFLQGLQLLRDRAPHELADEPVFEALRQGESSTMLHEAAAALLERLGKEA